MTTSPDVRDAGLLLRYALTSALSPDRHETYGRLLDRYHADPDLRGAFDEIAAGVGVRVLASDRRTGLVLSAEEDSPLSAGDTSQWLSISSAADRLIYGVALAGAAAWFYPNARALRDPGDRRGHAIDVDALIRRHAAEVESGQIVMEDDLGDAWDAYVARKQVEESKTNGKLRRKCTVAMCEQALTMLAYFGLLMVDRTAQAPRPELTMWRATDRFRAHVAASGGPLAWHTIAHSDALEHLAAERDSGAEQAGEDDPAGDWADDGAQE